MTDPNPIRRRRVVTWDLWGWVQIASELEVCERTAYRYYRRDSDANPLPVKRIGGKVVASRDDLAAWAEREQEREA